MTLNTPNQRKRKLKKRLVSLVALFVLIVLIVGSAFLLKRFYDNRKQQDALSQIANVPSETVLPTAVNSQNPEIANTQTLIPAELNLQVLFTSQAPTGNWDHQHEEDCEEASMLMASRYFSGMGIASAEDAETALAQIVDWENTNLGVSDSITADQVAQTLIQMLTLKAEIIHNPTVDDIKLAITENELVIVPSAGRLLGNSFYTAPGPLYHMLLIKGFTQTQFITNDPGTRHGENYPYDFKTILDANHDWNGADVNNGAHVIIVVSR